MKYISKPPKVSLHYWHLQYLGTSLGNLSTKYKNINLSIYEKAFGDS